MASACSIRVRGVVQGVGFRPFVYRLARANTLGGWVLNGEEGVEIYLEGAEQGLQAFVREMKMQPPPAASIAEMEVQEVAPLGVHGFTIRESQRRERPTVRISPDLPVCERLPRRAFRSAQSALRLSLHQLHQLRPALHRSHRPALRPLQHHDERLAAR